MSGATKTAFDQADIVSASKREERDRLCHCDRRAHIFAYIVIGAISTFVFWTFVNNLHFVRDSADEKVELQHLVLQQRNRLDEAFLKMNVAEGEYPDGVLDVLEKQNVGDFGPESFWFVLDFDSRFWAMGSNPLLAMQQTAENAVVRPGKYSAKDMDENADDNPIADFTRVAKRGGGYVEFRWKDNIPMIAYVTTLHHYPLVVGGAMPLQYS